MDLGFTDEQSALLALAREWAEREIAPRVADYDRDERFPRSSCSRPGSSGSPAASSPPSTAEPASTTSRTPR